MMDWTDRHCRYLHRLLSPNARLYTEMLTTGALIHGDQDRFLRFDNSEHPVALQLGGSEPEDLALCAKMGEDAGYDEINLNCGCPSDRVQSGRFGACLMKEPETVARCIEAMRSAISIPVTIKSRIGIDDSEDYAFLESFLRINKDAGCDHFIIHARKAWLKGLSPKENRDIPPLSYETVHRVKDEYPELFIAINGGLKDLSTILDQLEKVDSVMIGREAYHNPYILALLERGFYNPDYAPNLGNVLNAIASYADKEAKDMGTPLKSVARHMTGLFAGRAGARYWRQQLANRAFKTGATGQLFVDIYKEMQIKFGV